MDQPVAEHRRRRIAILVGEDTYYGRAVITGIAAYAAAHAGWDCYLTDPRSACWAQLRAWQPEGVIAHLANERLANQAADIPVPLVNTSDRMPVPYPTVTMDSVAIGRMAADYFHGRGYGHYACFTGRLECAYAADRTAGFADALAGHGHTPHSYACQVQSWQRNPAQADDGTLDELRAWLRGLPTPVALFASDNAMLIARLCLYLGLHVPGEVAILSGDGDQVGALLAAPPLSTVDVSLNEIGYRAAHVLDRWLDGRSPAAHTHVTPRGVTVRPSTEAAMLADPVVTRALHLIRAHALKSLTVERLAEDLPISRRELERRFRCQLGTTPHAEILRVRLREAERLLITSQSSLAEIAQTCGFPNQQYFTHVLQRERGITPARFRTLYRLVP